MEKILRLGWVQVWMTAQCRASGVRLSHVVDPSTGAKAFAGGNFAPPWFPSTTITPGGVASATVTSSVQRVRWFNNSAY